MERIALVTGSTNNIGKAIADVLSKEGYPDFDGVNGVVVRNYL